MIRETVLAPNRPSGDWRFQGFGHENGATLALPIPCALTGCAGACYPESPEIVLHRILIPKKLRFGTLILRRNSYGDAS
jgi:hypothetical protein